MRGWDKGREIAEHGQSWKQMYLELSLSKALEEFGLYMSLPPGYEEEFCRPALDASHPKWAALYPKAPAARADGRLSKERFCANAVDENDTDSRILNGGDTGWPHLEKLKELCRANLASFENTYAWATLADKESYLAQLKAEADAAAAAGAAGAGGANGPATGPGAAAGAPTVASASSPASAATPAAAPAAAAAPPGGDAAAGAAASISAFAVPLTATTERARAEALAASYKRDDLVDAQCTGSNLREFVDPEVLAEWRKSGMWPASRGASILTRRATELQTLLDQVQAAEDDVFHLTLTQLPSHLDLELILSRLPNLCSLQLTYGMRNVGMKYDRALFGMRVADADSLARCIKMTETLTSLSLTANALDDNALMVLMSGLLSNQTVTHLDLSHNAITSNGMQLVAKLLRGPCVLSCLNLSNNKGDERAGKHLGRALRHNDSLVELNLRLNDLGDEGGRALLEGLRQNSSLAALNLSSNRLGSTAAATFAQVVAAPECALTSVDLSGNALDESDMEVVRRAVSANTTLTSLDLRGNTGVAPTSENVQAIMATVRANEVRLRDNGGVAPLTGAYADVMQKGDNKRNGGGSGVASVLSFH